MHLFHRFVPMPISLGLMKRQVVARRSCVVCGRTFIQKPWYVNWLGCRKWMETRRLDVAEVNSPAVCDDSPQKTYSTPPNSGIKVETWDDKDFYFYTDIQSEVENIMHLMGYDSHGVWYSLFAHREEPATPDKYNQESSKKVPDEKLIRSG